MARVLRSQAEAKTSFSKRRGSPRVDELSYANMTSSMTVTHHHQRCPSSEAEDTESRLEIRRHLRERA